MHLSMILQSLRIFISVSIIEGGPLPTLEALACNVFPIVTNTGFNAEVIDHGKNGFLVDKGVKVSEISKYINLAWDIDEDVSQSIQKYNWDNVSNNIFNFLKFSILLFEIGSKDSISSISSPKKWIL